MEFNIDRKKAVRLCCGALGVCLLALVCTRIPFGRLLGGLESVDLRNAGAAVERGFCVEEALPRTAAGAEYIASRVPSGVCDTVFLGYWLGMTELEYRERTGRNFALGKLEKYNRKQTYMLRISEPDGRDFAVPMVLMPEFHDGRLYRLVLGYVHLNGSKTPEALPLEDSVELIDGLLRDRYLEDGWLRFTSGTGWWFWKRPPGTVSYYRGNTCVVIASSTDGKSSMCSITFLDCLGYARMVEAKKASALAREEDARREIERRREETAGDF